MHGESTRTLSHIFASDLCTYWGGIALFLFFSHKKRRFHRTSPEVVTYVEWHPVHLHRLDRHRSLQRKMRHKSPWKKRMHGSRRNRVKLKRENGLRHRAQRGLNVKAKIEESCRSVKSKKGKADAFRDMKQPLPGCLRKLATRAASRRVVRERLYVLMNRQGRIIDVHA